MIRERKS